MRVRIGTSGFGIARSKYTQSFSCVEVQHTFYQPPRVATLERWRTDAPTEFEFVLKAWQLITHDAKSPTYRRLKRKLSEVEKQEAGYFRPTPVVKDAWAVTLDCARALKARTVLFQCPASFKQTKENIANLTRFFQVIKAGEANLKFCWEPRGDWDAGVVKSLCDDLDLWHVVDPFTARSVTPDKLYFRLHGRTGWRYEYEDGELFELAEMLGDRASRGKNSARKISSGMTPYVFFNNVRMIQDALRFREIISARDQEP